MRFPREMEELTLQTQITQICKEWTEEMEQGKQTERKLGNKNKMI